MLLLFVPVAMSATAADLAQSVAVPSADIVSATYTGHADASDVLTSLGVLTPTEGSDFAYLSTGKVGYSTQPGEDLPPMGRPKGDRSTLTLELLVPTNANSFAFDFYFLSAEYPEYVGTPYNDEFLAQITGSAWSGNAALDSSGNTISVNSALFTVTQPSQLAGTGFGNGVGGGTGWLTAVVPANPGDTITVVFTVYDVTDGVYDSGVLLDDFYWSESEINTPIIVTDVDIDFLTPKRGPTSGGVTTRVIGTGFNESCVVKFDNIEALSSTYVSETEIEAEVPPHSAELVDVTVDCVGVFDDLVGGFTYYDEEAGELPPVIETVDPYQVDVLGGELVTVSGQDFAEGVELRLDEELVDVTFIDAQTLEFTSPLHDAGLADLRAINPTGLEDLRSGALLYVSNPTWPPEDTGAVDTATEDTGSSSGNGGGKVEGCSCSTLPESSGGLLVLLVPLVVAFRRRK